MNIYNSKGGPTSGGLTHELNKWIEYNNRSYHHSALVYKSPAQVEAEFYSQNRAENSSLIGKK